MKNLECMNFMDESEKSQNKPKWGLKGSSYKS